MDTNICEINKDNILSFAPYLEADDMVRIASSDTKAIGLVTKDSKSCGALFYRLNRNESSVFLESVCVDETCRRQGLGKKLVDSFLQDEFVSKAENIVAPIPPVNQDISRAFFISTGFNEFVDGEWFFEIDYKRLKEWFKEDIGHHFKLNYKADKHNIGKISSLTRALSKQFPDVEYDDEISFVVDHNPKNGYVLSKRTKDNDVIMNSVYIPKNMLKTGNSMLYIAFTAYKTIMKENSKLYIVGPTDSQKDIWWKIFPDAPYSYMLYARINRENEEEEEQIISRAAFSLPRINTLCKMLQDGGYCYSVDYSTISDNTIMLKRDEGKRPISIKCTMLDEAAEYFDLEFCSVFTYDSLTDSEKQSLSNLKKEQGLSKVEFSADRNLAIVSLHKLEEEMIIDEAEFLSLLATFEKEIDELKLPSEMIEVELKQTLLEDE